MSNEPTNGDRAYNLAKGANWANWIAKTAQTGSKMRGGADFAKAAGGNGGLLGTAGKFLAPMALVAGAQGVHKGVGEMANAEDGWDMSRGGLRTLGGAAGMTAGGIGTVGLAGMGASALGMAGTGAALTGAAAAAAPVAAVAAPIAAAIGLGFRGDSFLKEQGLDHLTMGSQVSGGYDIGSGAGSGLAEMLGASEGGMISQGAGYVGGALGGAVGAVTGAATSIGAGVAGLGKDAWDLVTSW